MHKTLHFLLENLKKFSGKGPAVYPTPVGAPPSPATRLLLFSVNPHSDVIAVLVGVQIYRKS